MACLFAKVGAAAACPRPERVEFLRLPPLFVNSFGSAKDLLGAGTLIASRAKAATADTNGVAIFRDPVLALVKKRAHPDSPVTSLRCHLSGQLLRLRFSNKSTYYLSPQRRSGEIGIRTRLKIWRGQTHVGSSPTSGTIT